MRTEGLPAREKPAHAGLYRNPVCRAGGILFAFFSVLAAVSVPLAHTVLAPSPFFPIFADVVFPGLMVLGVVVFLYGMRREAKRRVAAGETDVMPFPAVDLNDGRQRLRFVAVVGAVLATLALLVVTTRDAVRFTDTRVFCGKTCHASMAPEHAANLRSPHANVSCVECHVGDGVVAYWRSKILGLDELYATVFNTYQRPIPAPVHTMPPARHTCGNCHWAEEHFGARLIQRPYYRYDEQNTAEQISVLVRTGGGGAKGEGIHFRMALDKEIAFVAEDEQRQRIPWVKATSKNGASVEYLSTERTIAPEKLVSMKRRILDCIDCHNRAGHDIGPPDVAVDHALAAGAISPTLPWIKKVSVEAVSKRYASSTEASGAIRRDIAAFYQKGYLAIASARAADISKAGDVVAAIWNATVFPGMKVDGASYPSHIGHTSWPGCFRCHDGKHVSADGKVLPNDCAVCHTLPQRAGQAPLGEMISAPGTDWHPWQIGTKHLAVKKHSEILCHECHTAGRRPKTECEDCHQ